MGPAAFAISMMLSLAGIAHPTAPRWARLVFAFLIASSAIGLVAAFTSGCAGHVVDTASTCPDHAIPATTCDVPLPANCVFSPNIHLTVDGSCVVDVLTGCQYSGNFVHFELPYDGGAVSSPGQFYGSTCTFTAEQ